MKINPSHLISVFLVVFLFSFTQFSFAQDSLSTKTPMYYKLDSTTDSISAFGERPNLVNPNNFKVSINKSYLIYIIIALIIGSVFSTVVLSLAKKKEMEFKKWNLKNRKKISNNKK